MMAISSQDSHYQGNLNQHSRCQDSHCQDNLNQHGPDRNNHSRLTLNAFQLLVVILRDM
jgi:hypothetical protein